MNAAQSKPLIMRLPTLAMVVVVASAAEVMLGKHTFQYSGE